MICIISMPPIFTIFTIQDLICVSLEMGNKLGKVSLVTWVPPNVALLPPIFLVLYLSFNVNLLYTLQCQNFKLCPFPNIQLRHVICNPLFNLSLKLFQSLRMRICILNICYFNFLIKIPS